MRKRVSWTIFTAIRIEENGTRIVFYSVPSTIGKQTKYKHTHMHSALRAHEVEAEEKNKRIKLRKIQKKKAKYVAWGKKNSERKWKKKKNLITNFLANW